MRKAIVLSLFIFVAACERFPTNPPQETEAEPYLSVVSVDVQYLPMAKEVDGLIAKKMNVVSLEFSTGGLSGEVKAVELVGCAGLQGPPYDQEHGICFRTDRLDVEKEQPGMGWNLIDSVEPGTVYTLVRCKLPMNEYAPFEGDQGMVTSVKIKQAWAVDGNGNRTPLKIAE
jgi:hypothetical protein